LSNIKRRYLEDWTELDLGVWDRFVEKHPGCNLMG